MTSHVERTATLQPMSFAVEFEVSRTNWHSICNRKIVSNPSIANQKAIAVRKEKMISIYIKKGVRCDA